MAHDDDAPDVGYLDRSAVHAMRWGSYVEPVPMAGCEEGIGDEHGKHETGNPITVCNPERMG